MKPELVCKIEVRTEEGEVSPARFCTSKKTVPADHSRMDNSTPRRFFLDSKPCLLSVPCIFPGDDIVSSRHHPRPDLQMGR